MAKRTTRTREKHISSIFQSILGIQEIYHALSNQEKLILHMTIVSNQELEEITDELGISRIELKGYLRTGKKKMLWSIMGAFRKARENSDLLKTTGTLKLDNHRLSKENQEMRLALHLPIEKELKLGDNKTIVELFKVGRISARLKTCLLNNTYPEIATLHELHTKTDKDLRKIRQFGRIMLDEVHLLKAKYPMEENE